MTSENAETMKMMIDSFIQTNGLFPVVKMLFDHGGIIRGGFLRDILAGDMPKDIDIVIPKTQWVHVYPSLPLFGYKLRGDPHDDETFRIAVLLNDDEINPTNLFLDIYLSSVEDDGKIFLSKYPPDFNVNMLGYNGDMIFNIDNFDGGVDDIFNNIISHRARMMRNLRNDPDERTGTDRIAKMIRKGYTIEEFVPRDDHEFARELADEDDHEHEHEHEHEHDHDHEHEHIIEFDQ